MSLNLSPSYLFPFFLSRDIPFQLNSITLFSIPLPFVSSSISRHFLKLLNLVHTLNKDLSFPS